MIQLGAFIMVFVNIPNSANQGETYDKPKHMDEPNKGKRYLTPYYIGHKPYKQTFIYHMI